MIPEEPVSTPAECLPLRPPEPLEWRVHLARRQPLRALVVLVFVGVAGLAALLLFRSLFSALLAVGLLLAATSEFLLPVTYRLTDEGAEARGFFTWRKMAWREVKRVYTGPDAVKLSPLLHGGPREAFRGVLLRCEKNQSAVCATIESYRHAATGD